MVLKSGVIAAAIMGDQRFHSNPAGILSANVRALALHDRKLGYVRQPSRLEKRDPWTCKKFCQS